jgi:hypothetical protein
MVDPLAETYFLLAIAAHPQWALLTGVVYVCCAFVLWQCEIPQWATAVIFVSLVLIFTVVGFAIACTSGSIVIS